MGVLIFTGTWPVSSSVAGFAGANYQYHRANGAPPDGVIIDNEDANTRSTGTWTASSSVSGYEGSHYSYHAAGVGDHAFTWPLSGITAGDYQLYAKWTSHSNRASNASYSVNHVGGTTPVVVNQKTNGGAWVELGTFTLDASSEIVLSDAGDGYVIADGLYFVAEGTPANTFTWNLDIGISAEYEVFARWTAHANRASDAVYTINHANGSTGVTVDQRYNGGGWYSLGRYTLDSASSVRLTDEADGYVIADGLPSIGARPDWWPDDVPHPDDPPLELSCSATTPSNPGFDAPEPPNNCLDGYRTFLAGCKKSTLKYRGFCVAAATVAYIACLSDGG